MLAGESWDATDLIEAAPKLDEMETWYQEAATLKSEIIRAISKRSSDLFDTPAFKSFVQAYPEWVIRLLKIDRPVRQSLPGPDETEGEVEVATEGKTEVETKDETEAENEVESEPEPSITPGGENGLTPDTTNAWNTISNPTNDWNTPQGGSPGGYFSGEGQVLGSSTGGRGTAFVYGQGGRKPPSRGFRIRYPPQE